VEAVAAPAKERGAAPVPAKAKAVRRQVLADREVAVKV
jgi:hypothetical protein